MKIILVILSSLSVLSNSMPLSYKQENNLLNLLQFENVLNTLQSEKDFLNLLESATEVKSNLGGDILSPSEEIQLIPSNEIITTVDELIRTEVWQLGQHGTISTVVKIEPYYEHSTSPKESNEAEKEEEPKTTPKTADENAKSIKPSERKLPEVNVPINKPKQEKPTLNEKTTTQKEHSIATEVPELTKKSTESPQTLLPKEQLKEGAKLSTETSTTREKPLTTNENQVTKHPEDVLKTTPSKANVSLSNKASGKINTSTEKENTPVQAKATKGPDNEEKGEPQPKPILKNQ